MTMLEVLVSIGILAMISAMVYGSLAVTLKSQQVVMRSQERFHSGRVALARMARDLSCAYLSKHVGVMEKASETLFNGSDDEVTFTYLGHTRVFPKKPESDQGVITYSLKSGKGEGRRLIRREKKYVDDRPDKEGDEMILAEGVKKLELEYWDPNQEDWTDSWKAEMPETEPVLTEASDRKALQVMTKLTTGEDVDEDFRLPPRIRIRLMLVDSEGNEYPFETQVELRMKEPFQW